MSGPNLLWTLPPAFEPMRAYPQWFIYRLYDRDPATDKYKKQPIDPRTRAMPPEGEGGIKQCSDFETVARVGAEMQASAKAGQRYVPGFYFTEHDPFAFLDIDQAVVTDANGKPAWSALALELLKSFPHAARETSSSGLGWHIIAKTTVSSSKGRKDTEHNLEFYTRDRGVALTLENVAGHAGADETQTFEAIRAQYFPAKAADESAEWTDSAVWSSGSKLNLPEAIEARKLESRVFADLMAGKTDRYESPSEADAGFAKDLLRLSGGNCDAVLDYMQQPGLALHRAKWTEGYLRDTIIYAYRELAADPTANVGLAFRGPIPAGASLTPIVAANAVIQSPSERFPIYTFDEIVARPRLRWAIKGILPVEGVGAVYGPPGSGKSFLLFDMLASIDRGSPWFGRRTKQAPVLYIALEGAGGFQQRAEAYAKKFPKPAMRFITAPLDLRQPGDAAALVEAIRAKDWKGNGVIAVDTLNAAMPGADENSSEDMGSAISALKAIQRAFGGVVILVHHTGKNVDKGLRGHSSLLAALDVAIEVAKGTAGPVRTWTTAKVKDGPDDTQASFTLENVNLGTDEDGDAISSCIVRPVAGSTTKVEEGKRGLGDNQKMALTTLSEIYISALARDAAPDTVPYGASYVAWAVAKETVGRKLSVEKRRQSTEAARVLQSLVDSGRLATDGEYLWPNLQIAQLTPRTGRT